MENNTPKTLRDEFAMAALTGLLAHGLDDDDRPTPARYSEIAYMIADAMLKQRTK